MNRAHNYFAGPAVLPVDVVKATSEAAMDFNGMGVSIMEISHRSKEFDKVFTDAQNDALKIMGLSPDDYSVLFLGGGASTQFLMVPYNFMKSKADYVNTGAWAKKAIKEGKFFGDVNVIGSSEDGNFNYIPKGLKYNDDADYLHITTNNTIYGTEWKETPNTKAPIVADMSSDMFAMPREWDKYSLIYAGAQKNIGPSGVTMVIVKNEWYEKEAKKDIPTMMSYGTHIDKQSMFNTPPTLPVFTVGQVFKWILNKGGLEAIKELNEKKAGYIYDVIDEYPEFFKGTVKDKKDRSLMNITFNLPEAELEAKFIAEAKEKHNMLGLKGHRSVGGIRASVYNACPEEHCQDLAKYMVDFMKANK